MIFWPDVVISIVKSGTDKIVHPSIHDREFLHLGLLHIKDLGRENAAIGRDETSGLKNELELAFAQERQDAARKFLRGLGIFVAVNRSETAAEVQELDPGTALLDLVNEFQDLLERLNERIAGLDLGTDMHMNAQD